MKTKGQGVQAADAAISAYRNQALELNSEFAAVNADREMIGRQLGEALDFAAHTLLQDAAQATLDYVGQELGLGWLPNRRAELEQQRASWAARLVAIEADPQFVQRESLLHPTHGALARERQQCNVVIGQLQAHLQRFQTETFQWLQARELQRQTQPGGLSSFWNAVTFGGYREDRAKLRCASELGYQSYDQLLHDYQSSDVRLRQIQERIGQLDAQSQRVLALLEEHGKLYGWTHDFETLLCQTLRSELAQALSRQDLRTVHMRIRPPLRPTIARAHALQKKLEYLGNLGGFLQREVADRSQRVDAIAKTRMTWAMKPWDRLVGDKSKWLLALPAAKRESTRKQSAYARRMHRNIVDYDDYDDYDYYLLYVPDFLAWDAFAWAADEPMPYEGFSRGVIEELAPFRQEHGQERADFSAYRQADKSMGTDEQHHRDELAHEHEAIRDAELESEGLVEAAAAAVAVDHALEMADAS